MIVPIKQKVMISVLSSRPFFYLRKLAGADLIIPYYHMISDQEVLHIKHLYRHKNIRQFKEDLDFLLKHYIPVGLFDIISLLKNNARLPQGSFLLTFDDGFKEIHDIVAPILREKGIPATFFINSAFIDNEQLCYQHKLSLLVETFGKATPKSVQNIKEILTKQKITCKDLVSSVLSITYERKDIIDEIARSLNIDFNVYLKENSPYLTSNQISSLLKQGFTIGAHSIDHPLYSLIPLKEQLHQTIESVKFIKEKFRLDYGAFAFPHSDHGVTKKFFAQIYGNGLVDISFGTGGMIKDFSPFHLQRFSLEKPIMPADRIVTYQYARTFFKRLVGNGKMARE